MADSLDTAISSAVASASGVADPSPAQTETAPATTSTPDVQTTSPAAPPKAGSAPQKAAKVSRESLTTPAPAAETKPTSTGSPPPERWETVLENARKKAREDVTAELRQQLGTDLSDPNAIANVRAFLSNPAQYLRQYAPHFGIQLAQAAAQATQAQPTEPPKPDLVAEDGTPAYSQRALDALLEWRFNQFAKSLDARFAPVEQTYQTITQQSQWAQAQAAARADIAEAETWDDWTDVKPRVIELLSEDKRRTLASSYAQARKELKPQLDQKRREAILEEIKTRPPVPATLTPTAPTRSARKAKTNGLDIRSAVEAAMSKHAGA